MKRDRDKRGDSSHAYDTGIRHKISSLFELPKEIVMNLPLITLIGSQELSIENYRSLVEYSDTLVRISTSAGMFKVEGRQICLKQLTSESVTITGSLTLFGYIL